MLRRTTGNSVNYLGQAQTLVDDYLFNINKKSAQKYTVSEDEVNRIALLLEENGGMLYESIRIQKAKKEEDK